MKKSLTLFIISLLILLGCKKESIIPAEIQTVSVKAISPSSIIFSGNIKKIGNQKILDYGFMYSNDPSFDQKNGVKVSLGNNPSVGDFTKTADNIVLNSNYYQNTIWARAYITDELGTVFGVRMNVDLPSTFTSSINPSSGKVGDLIKISGKFYSPSLSTVNVTFEGVAAKVISATDSEITVEVPAGIAASHSQNITVEVKIGNNRLQNVGFKILANFKDFSPKSGIAGTYITFSGDNLPYSNYYYNNEIQIYVDDVVGYPYFISPFPLPLNLKASSQIAISINGKKTIFQTPFTVTPPQISSITPTTVMPSDEIQILGNNFAINTQDNVAGRPMVKLGDGIYTTAYTNGTDRYRFNVPKETLPGEYPLYLRVGPHEVTTSQKVTVLEHSASSFMPTAGPPGLEVNITGRFSRDRYYNVYFGNNQYQGTATSATNVRAYVPTNMNEGKVKIKIDLGSSIATLPGEFEIRGPSFDSFAPISGVAGSILTIRGVGFNPNDYYLTVRFGTIAIKPNSVTENMILVTVPSNVNPGAMKLSIVSGGQTLVHPTNFTITN